MKGKKFAAFAAGLLVALLLSFGAMESMISGLELPVEYMEELYRAWAIAALAGCIIFLFKRGWIAALVLTGAGLIWLWPEEAFSLPLRALITRLSWVYDSAYGCGVLEFPGVVWQKQTLDLPLMVWGCLIALAAAGTVMRGRGLTLTAALSLLPAAATIVVTNTVPAAHWLYLLMLGLILLILPATVRRHCPGQGAKLTFLTMLPLALLLGLLFRSYPKDDYVNRSEEYLDSVVSWWQNTVTFSFDSTGLVDQTPAAPNASATANLSRVGPRNLWGYTVMEAEADYTGTVYIRGQDFDTYDGVSWTAMENRWETFGGMPDHGSWIYDGEITLRTATVSNVLYLPYYPTTEQPLEGGRLENSADLREYAFGVRHPAYADLHRFDAPAAGTPDSRYIRLPSDTHRWAMTYLQDHFDTSLLNASHNYLIAEAVADHVRSLVPYDTGTPRMSGDYNDFAQWFLEEAETGYCVHFATAATVLLRAAGVPARYVTGYMFTAKADETVEVTADQAHAWAEYYHEDLNTWIVLEATPADLAEDATAPSATEAEETEPPTEVPSGEDRETRPDGERPAGQEKAIDLTWLWTALKWLLLPAGLWLVLLAQYAIRRQNRAKHRSPNARALQYWQDVELLCRVTRQTPPEELEDLARKAKFSQHTLTAEELDRFRAWLKTEQTKPRPWHRKIVCKYVLALW